MVDLCFCFLSLKRVESGEGEVDRREGASTLARGRPYRRRKGGGMTGGSEWATQKLC